MSLNKTAPASAQRDTSALPNTLTHLLAAAVLSLSSAAGCISASQRFDDLAREYRLSTAELPGAGFVHRVYFNSAWRDIIASGASPSAARLHVYLAGDGSPFVDHRWIAGDPTPRRPLTLALLAQDETPGVLLGRPCYHGLDSLPPCTPRYWTSHRYGEAVLDSLSAALRTLLAAGGFHELVLIGYSGGGTLAMLLAERLPETRAVLTLAANLDTAAWAERHGYTPLSGSLNPARRPPLPAEVIQHHYGGGRDRNVPPALLRRALAGQPGARLRVVAVYDHHCCWRRDWPTRLRELAAAAARRATAERTRF